MLKGMKFKMIKIIVLDIKDKVWMRLTVLIY